MKECIIARRKRKEGKKMAKKKENRLVVGARECADMIPEWLLNEVKAERMVYGLASLIGRGPVVGDAEICAYLMTGSLRQPLSSEHVNIYMYLVTRLFKKREKEVPEDIRRDELTEWEEHEFEELRNMIYEKRGEEIKHPVLNVMRQLKKEIKRKEAKDG